MNLLKKWFKGGDTVVDRGGREWTVQGGAGDDSLRLIDKKTGETATKYSGLIKHVDPKDIPGG